MEYMTARGGDLALNWSVIPYQIVLQGGYSIYLPDGSRHGFNRFNSAVPEWITVDGTNLHMTLVDDNTIIVQQPNGVRLFFSSIEPASPRSFIFNVVRIEDREGRAVVFTYHPSLPGQLIQASDGEHAVTIEYDQFARPTTATVLGLGLVIHFDTDTRAFADPTLNEYGYEQLRPTTYLTGIRACDGSTCYSTQLEYLASPHVANAYTNLLEHVTMPLGEEHWIRYTYEANLLDETKYFGEELVPVPGSEDGECEVVDTVGGGLELDCPTTLTGGAQGRNSNRMLVFKGAETVGSWADADFGIQIRNDDFAQVSVVCSTTTITATQGGETLSGTCTACAPSLNQHQACTTCAASLAAQIGVTAADVEGACDRTYDPDDPPITTREHGLPLAGGRSRARTWVAAGDDGRVHPIFLRTTAYEHRRIIGTDTMVRTWERPGDFVEIDAYDAGVSGHQSLPASTVKRLREEPDWVVERQFDQVPTRDVPSNPGTAAVRTVYYEYGNRPGVGNNPVVKFPADLGRSGYVPPNFPYKVNGELLQIMSYEGILPFDPYYPTFDVPSSYNGCVDDACTSVRTDTRLVQIDSYRYGFRDTGTRLNVLAADQFNSPQLHASFVNEHLTVEYQGDPGNPQIKREEFSVNPWGDVIRREVHDYYAPFVDPSSASSGPDRLLLKEENVYAYGFCNSADPSVFWRPSYLVRKRVSATDPITQETTWADTLFRYGADGRLLETVARHTDPTTPVESNHVLSVGGGGGRGCNSTRDSDCDGVDNSGDLCPGTPEGTVVDTTIGSPTGGCPVDLDGDGVPNGNDACPGTPCGTSVNSQGCPVSSSMCFNPPALDSDCDGVSNVNDMCPGTPKNVQVVTASGPTRGCPVDLDTDGVLNGVDACPGTPCGVIVSSDGCPAPDTDDDGIPDPVDLCPGTPSGTAVDVNGCPANDSDQDGVKNWEDECENTIIGTPVLRDGCPDADGDGVSDPHDLCSGTDPVGQWPIDENGCPQDSDGDGVIDHDDACRYTNPAFIAYVGSNGCLTIPDSDLDGVPDGVPNGNGGFDPIFDLCPNSPVGALVDATGCQYDSDGDGVNNGLDLCPNSTADDIADPGFNATTGCVHADHSVARCETAYFTQLASGLKDSAPISGVAQGFPTAIVASQGDLVTRVNYYTSGAEAGQVESRKIETQGEDDGIKTEYQYEHHVLSREQVTNLPYANFEKTIHSVLGAPLAVKNANGVEYQITYDGFGRPLSVTPPTPEVPVYFNYPDLHHAEVHFGEDASGAPIGGVDPSKATRERYTFDDAGRRIRTERFDAEGRLVGQDTVFDALGRAVSHSTWDLVTNLSAALTPKTLFAEFDFQDRAARITPPDNSGHGVTVGSGADDKSVRFQYFGTHCTESTVSVVTTDAVSDAGITQELQASKKTLYYNALGQLIMVDMPEGADAVYRYDVFGKLATVNLLADLNEGASTPRTERELRDKWWGFAYTRSDTPPINVSTFTQSQTRSLEYDTLGRLRRARNPENGTVRYLDYDAIGNALRIEDENGRAAGYQLKYDYDDVGRLLAVSRLNLSDGSETVLGELGYDADEAAEANNLVKGELTKLVAYLPDVNGAVLATTRVFVYSGLNGRLSATINTVQLSTGRTNTGRMDYLYSNLGELESLTLLAGREVSHHFTYAHGFLTQQESCFSGDCQTYVPSVDYNAAGGVGKISFANGTYTEITPDVQFRPSQIKAGKAGDTPFFDTGLYKFDGAGNIYAMGSDQFGYDRISRLTGAEVSDRNDAPKQHIFSYAFDPYGNMTNRELKNASTLFGGEALTDPLSYNQQVLIQNRTYQTMLNGTSYTDNRIHDLSAKGNGELFAYDGNGNLTRDERFTYSWDELNRLRSVRDLATGNLVSQYWYDAQNERIALTEFTAGVANKATLFWRDEGAQVQFETTDFTAGAQITSQEHIGYGYVLGKVAYQAKYRTLINASNAGVHANNACQPPGMGTIEFITRPNGYDAVIPIEDACEEIGVTGITVTLYENPHDNSGQTQWNGQWAEREKYTVDATEEPFPTSVAFPHLLYDRDYRVVLVVSSTLNSTGLLGDTPLQTGEATWKVPKDQRKVYVAAVHDGRDGHVDLWWQPAASQYNVYVRSDSGERRLLTGEPLSQPGVDLDPGQLEGIDLLSIFEVEGVQTDGSGDVIGGTGNPGGGGRKGQCQIDCPPTGGCTIGGGSGGPGGILDCILPPETTREIRYFHTDHLGTPRATSDEQGNLMSRHDYEPFGTRLPGPGSPPNRELAGEEHQLVTALNYVHARYLAPQYGRFLSADPMAQPTFSEPGSWNRFSYVSNHPLIASDPTGLWEPEVVNGEIWMVSQDTDSVAGLYMRLGMEVPEGDDTLNDCLTAGEMRVRLTYFKPEAAKLEAMLQDQGAMLAASPLGAGMSAVSLSSDPAYRAWGRKYQWSVMSGKGGVDQAADPTYNCIGAWEFYGGYAGNLSYRGYADKAQGLDLAKEQQTIDDILVKFYSLATNPGDLRHGAAIQYVGDMDSSAPGVQLGTNHMATVVIVSQTGTVWLFSKSGWAGPAELTTLGEMDVVYKNNQRFMWERK